LKLFKLVPTLYFVEARQGCPSKAWKRTMNTESHLKTFVANVTPGHVPGVESRTRYLATPLVGAPLTAVEVCGSWDTDVPMLSDSTEGRLFAIVEGGIKVLAGGTYHRVKAGQALYVPSGISCEAIVETERFQALVACFGGTRPGKTAVPSLAGMELPAVGARVFPKLTPEQTHGAFGLSEAIVESGRYVPLTTARDGYAAIYVTDGELEIYQHASTQRVASGAFVYIPGNEKVQVRATEKSARVLIVHAS